MHDKLRRIRRDCALAVASIVLLKSVSEIASRSIATIIYSALTEDLLAGRLSTWYSPGFLGKRVPARTDELRGICVGVIILPLHCVRMGAVCARIDVKIIWTLRAAVFDLDDLI